MENATEALKMAASILIFVGALSLAMFSLTKARQASTAVMAAESSETYYDIKLNEVTSVREVGLETVLPNLYSYYKNYNTILFYDGQNAGWNSSTGNFDSADKIAPICLYYTEALNTNKNNDGKTYLTRSILRIDSGDNSGDRRIYGLDINDERSRQEPWVKIDDPKLFVDALIKGEASPQYSWSRRLETDKNTAITTVNMLSGRRSISGLKINFQYMNYFNGKSLASYYNSSKKPRFIERIGRYNYKTVQKNRIGNNGDVIKGKTSSDSSEIELDDETSTDNENEVQKTAIQYIYIGDK